MQGASRLLAPPSRALQSAARVENDSQQSFFIETQGAPLI
jgi:hypothetical protein